MNLAAPLSPHLQTLAVLFIKLSEKEGHDFKSLIFESIKYISIEEYTPNSFYAILSSSKDALDHLEAIQEKFADRAISILLHTSDTSTSQNLIANFDYFARLLETSADSMFLISRAAYLSIMHGVRPTVATFTDSDTHSDLIYILPGTKKHKLRVVHPAKPERRARAAILDYLIAILIILAVQICARAPHTLSVIENRRRIEAENIDLHLAKLEPRWLASGGETINFSRSSRASHIFPFESGEYYILFSYLQDTGHASIRIRGIAYDIPNPITTNQALRIFRTNGKFQINKGDLIVVKGFESLDYIEYLKLPEEHYPYQYAIRFEDIIYPLGIEELGTGIVKECAWLLLVLAPGLLALLQFIFLSFLRYTPGCLLSSIRIVNPAGFAPGPLRSFLRFLVNISSPLFCFAHQLWPSLTYQHLNWADYLSGTQAVNKEEDKNGR